MRAAASESEFRSDPRGAYIATRCGMVFSESPALWGLVIWARPSAEDVERQIELLRATHLLDGVAPHRMFVDLSRLEVADPIVFQRYADYIRDDFARLAVVVTRLGLVPPRGMVGAAVSGFFAIVDPPYPVDRLAEADAAASWLGDEAFVIGEIERIAASVGGIPASLAHLRVWLEVRLASARLGDAAQALRVSPRALQRLLAEHATSFRSELRAARIRIAQHRLSSSTSSISEIAYEIGCSSPQHFSSMFRAVVGLPPSEWREAMAEREDKP